MKRKWMLVLALALMASVALWAGGSKEKAKDQPKPAQQAQPQAAQDTGPIEYPISGLGWETKSNVKAKKKYVFGCVVKNSTNPYMIGQMKGFEEAGKAMGFEAIALAPAKQDSIEEQVRIIEDLIQRGCERHRGSSLGFQRDRPGHREGLREEDPRGRHGDRSEHQEEVGPRRDRLLSDRRHHRGLGGEEAPGPRATSSP